MTGNLQPPEDLTDTIWRLGAAEVEMTWWNVGPVEWSLMIIDGYCVELVPVRNMTNMGHNMGNGFCSQILHISTLLLTSCQLRMSQHFSKPFTCPPVNSHRHPTICKYIGSWDMRLH